jgi:hypothetical protein
MSDIGVWINLGALLFLFLAITLLQRGKRRRLEHMMEQPTKLTRKVRYNPSDLQAGIQIGNWKLAAIAIAFILFGLLGRFLGFFPPDAIGFWWIPTVIGILMFIFVVK